MTNILITGIMGFIPSFFAKYIINNTDYNITGFGRNSDQRNLKRIEEIIDNPRLHLIYGDLSDNNCVSGLAEDMDYIVHMGAKTFVDFSIRDPAPFIQSNIIGTYTLLEEVKRSFKTDHKLKRMIVTSTDEVYGSILTGSYKEDARLNPTNPYSSSKAGADMLSLAYYNTYQLPIIITRTENNAGPFQHPQKAIPKFVKYALEGKKLPIYGDGNHRRQWLYVEDHCSAIYHLLTSEKAINGEIYHVAGSQELTNNELAIRILRILGIDNTDNNLIEHIDDYNVRPGHDRRYALNTDKIRSSGWKPKYKLDETLEKTVNWYKSNIWWL